MCCVLLVVCWLLFVVGWCVLRASWFVVRRFFVVGYCLWLTLVFGLLFDVFCVVMFCCVLLLGCCLLSVDGDSCSLFVIHCL